MKFIVPIAYTKSIQLLELNPSIKINFIHEHGGFLMVIFYLPPQKIISLFYWEMLANPICDYLI